MDSLQSNKHDRFVIHDFLTVRPFSSFLPGIAGPMGIPMWVFYVNRGQAVTSFGVESKDSPMMEFQPANKAYQLTPIVGFRTFLKLQRDESVQLYEPFSPWHRSEAARRQMSVGMNELEVCEVNPDIGLQTNVAYFTLSNENLAGLVRRVTLENTGHQLLAFELLDGLPAVIPYGVDNHALKNIGRTIEAWMQVSNVEQRMPFYRLKASAGDVAEVTEIVAGHFALSFVESNGQAELLPVVVDPAVVFGQNTALTAPDAFNAVPLTDLLKQRQITVGKTPCALFGLTSTLAPGESIILYGIFGHVSSLPALQAARERLLSPAYIHDKQREANDLVRDLTDLIATETSSSVFDAYCRQTFLDNVLRGGWPVLLGGGDDPHVYHIYSRKHGDLERDYNDFFLAAEYYSQGNSNYRDVNQSRRNDVLFEPQVRDFNIRAFVSLIQADGYNPLVVEGTTFTIPAQRVLAVLNQVVDPTKLESVLSEPFTPGKLLKFIDDYGIELRMSPAAFLALALENAEQHIEAAFGEGYWIDHWTYNLDLIERYLAIYPDRKDDLLFDSGGLTFFDSSAIVQPRDKKYVLADGRPRQYGAVAEDEEKAALLAGREVLPNWVRTDHGRGRICRAALFAKLVGLALLKFATLDPWGMGIEMEAGKPGWCDAMNGLPGLFGSSMPETFELLRLLRFLRATAVEKGAGAVSLPVEVYELLHEVVSHLKVYYASTSPHRDFAYWDAVAGTREVYRARVRLGFDGAMRELDLSDLAAALLLCEQKVQAGLARAIELNDGVPPTYFAYEVEEYETIRDADGEAKRDAEGRPYIRVKRFKPRVLPLFLEGPVRALKVEPDQAAARRLYKRIRSSALFDRKLGMYKVSASLEHEPYDIGRVRAFTPGWLENESIWLHMEYKWLLEVLRAGLYDEFYEDFQNTLIAFQAPEVYGRSPLENSSFIVSSAHPDSSLHGAGFVARLSGATAEFLSIWSLMMFGKQPFSVRDGELCLSFRPALPGWLFDERGKIIFKFLGNCTVTYHNPQRLDTFKHGIRSDKIVLYIKGGQVVELAGDVIGQPYAEMVRAGRVNKIDVFF